MFENFIHTHTHAHTHMYIPPLPHSASYKAHHCVCAHYYVNGPVGIEKTLPAQVAGDDHHDHWWCFAACTRAQTLTRTCPCVSCIWLLHPFPTSAQKGIDPLQLVLVVFF